MGFRVKVMPGVRVGVSSRGVRTSIGPRIASVHVGAGRTGVSTGIGPVSFGTTMGGYSSSSRTGSYERTYRPTPTQSAKLDEARALEAQLKRLTKAHLHVFSPVRKTIATPNPVESVASLNKRYVRQEQRGISVFSFKLRSAARHRGLTLAAEALEHQSQQAQAECALRQKHIDDDWQLLVSNDPGTVVRALTDAFGDNEAKSAAINVHDSTASVMMLVPDSSVLPERDWSITPSGNLSVRKMTAAARDSYYFDMVFSQLLATVNEGFAVAPGVDSIAMVLVRAKGAAKLNRSEFECIGFGTLYRAQLIQNSENSPFSIVQNASDGWRENIDNRLKFRAMDLSHEPDIHDLVKNLAKFN